MKTIDRTALQALLAGGNPCVLIDVLPPEYFAAGHLPGAKNCCVYEANFLELAAAAAPDKNATVVVYGSGHHSLASHTAGEKLEGADYTFVLNYREGLEEWQECGLPLEHTAEPPPVPQPREGRHELDLEKSTLHWTGRNITGAHHGTIAISGGWIDVAGAQARGGEFTLDMTRMSDLDLPSEDYRRMLIGHLQSDDFFDVAKFPNATFRLRHIITNPEARPGSVNADVVGALTLKGVTEDIGFPATIELQADGTLSAEAHFDLDRTRWNVLYGSGKFYEKLGKHLVHDLVSIALHIVTR